MSEVVNAHLLALSFVEIASLSAVALGLATIGFLSWRRNRRHQRASERLHAYKEQVVSYSDTMDRIKERHKMLPFTDPDFTAPMVGETLAAYEEIEVAVKKHGDHWLRLMDIWDQAQKLLEEKADADQLQSLLEDTQVGDRIVELKQQCESELNRLEQAHQRVDSVRTENEQALEGLSSVLEQVRSVGLSTAPYEAALADIAARTEEGLRLRTPDPLSAELEFEQARVNLAQLREQVDEVLRQFERVQEIDDRHRQASQLADQHRAEGLRYSESRGNPVPMLQEAKESLDHATDLLQQGDEDSATRRLDTADRLVDQVVESVEFQARFRQEGADRIRQMQSQVRELRDEVSEARKTHSLLRERHDPHAWSMVDDNAQQAAELADAMETLLNEASEAAADDQQQYYRAQELLDEVAAELPAARELAASVQQRLQELDELADRATRLAKDLEAESRRLDGVLRSSASDRPRSNHRFEVASEALARILHDTQHGRPHWPEIERGLQQIEKDLRAVDEMVREDLRLAEQAEVELREASHELRRCQGFYQMGISPNVGRAEGELRAAERELQRQNYEEAIHLANAAEQAAREALEQARREAEDREREAQRRRNRETAVQMASVIASVAAQAAATVATRRHRRRW